MSFDKSNPDNLLRRLAKILKIRRIQTDVTRFAARTLQRYSTNSESKRILFIEDLVPHAFLGAGFPRSNRILREMVRMGMAVTLYPAATSFESWSSLYQDVPRKVEVVLGHGLPRLEDFLSERQGYYHLLFVSRPHNMEFVRDLSRKRSDLFSGMRIIYDAEAIFTLREIERLHQSGDALSDDEAQNSIRNELALAESSDSIISVSNDESRIFAEHGARHVYTLGHALQIAPTPSSFDSREGILFVGALIGGPCPNLDAVMWFSEEVLPIIRRELGARIKLIIAGSGTDSLRESLSHDSIEILGKVENLMPLYDRARIFIAPTRYAAGIPLKIYEAAAHGLPVVTTSLPAAQLGWQDEVDLLSADGPEAFAEACVELYRNAEMWHRIRSHALDRVQRECSVETFSAKLRQIISETALAKPVSTSVAGQNPGSES